MREDIAVAQSTVIHEALTHKVSRESLGVEFERFCAQSTLGQCLRLEHILLAVDDITLRFPEHFVIGRL